MDKKFLEQARSNVNTPTIDLRVFEAMPGNSILVAIDAPRFTILAVTDGMTERSGLSKQDMVNKPFFEPFPANPSNPEDPNSAGQNIVFESFQHVLTHKELHQLPVVRYDLTNEQGVFTELYWRASNRPVLDNAGNLLYILHTSEDITEKVKAEQRDIAFQAIEKQHRLFMQAPMAIHILKGQKLVIELANDLTFNLWGKGREVIGKPLQLVLPELKDQGYIDILNQVRQTGETYEGYEIHVTLIVNGKSQQKLLNLVCQPYYEADNNAATGVITFVTDVTDKIETKKELRESRERFEAAIDAIEGVLWTNSPDGKMVGEQKAWAALTGQTYEQYQNFGWANAVHPDDAAGTITAWNKAVNSRTIFVYEHRVLMRGGSWGRFLARAIPLINEDGSIREWVGVHTNITAQRKIEQSLRESEERFRQLADDSPMFVFIIQPDPRATFSYWNKTWLNYTGQTHAEAMGRAWNGIVHPDDIAIVMHHYTAAFHNQFSYFIPAIRIKRHDGIYRWHAFKGNPRYLPGGTFNGFIGVGIDIHEQKLAEEAVKQSEQRTRLAVEVAHIGTFEINVARQTMIYSPRAAEIFGFDLDKQMSYQVFVNAIHPGDVPIRNQAHQVAKRTGELLYESRIILPDDTVRIIRINGKYFYQDLPLDSPPDPVASSAAQPTAYFSEDPAEHPAEHSIAQSTPHSTAHATADSMAHTTAILIGTVIDITDEKRSAELLEQKINERTRELKQVNEQLMQFTYSASHDLQEPLRKISILLDRLFVILGPTLGEESRSVAKRIQQTSGRMRTLIDDLLSYSNTTLGLSRFEETDLAVLLTDVVDDMGLSISEKNGKVYIGSLPFADCDRRQMRQLFQNLIDNALKYSKKDVSPEVRISAGSATGEQILHHFPHARASDTYLVLTVRDNGIGFASEDASRIFNLFYRLHGKEEYQGTGVGLAIAQKVVDNHRGCIRAQGIPGEGATFEIYLPLEQKTTAFDS